MTDQVFEISLTLKDSSFPIVTRIEIDWWLYIGFLVIMALSVAGILYHYIRHKKVIGIRAIQLVAVVLIVPVLAILGLRHILEGETIATIIGGLCGYLLSGVSTEDSKNVAPQKNTGKPKPTLEENRTKGWNDQSPSPL